MMSEQPWSHSAHDRGIIPRPCVSGMEWNGREWKGSKSPIHCLYRRAIHSLWTTPASAVPGNGWELI